MSYYPHLKHLQNDAQRNPRMSQVLLSCVVIFYCVSFLKDLKGIHCESITILSVTFLSNCKV